MYKEQLLFCIEREIQLLKQLSALIEEKDLNFRPTEKVRSSIELMQYLSNIGTTMMRWLVLNDISKDDWVIIRAERQEVTLQNFKDKLDLQRENVRKYMALISDEDLLNKEVELPNKERMPLGTAIISAPIKWLTAYRMELFLYLKLNGRSEISTKEAWSVLN